MQSSEIPQKIKSALQHAQCSSIFFSSNLGGERKKNRRVLLQLLVGVVLTLYVLTHNAACGSNTTQRNTPPLQAAWTLIAEIGSRIALTHLTRFTIEVAHSRYFVSERRASLSPNRPNANLDFEKQRFLDLGHGIIRRDAI